MPTISPSYTSFFNVGQDVPQVPHRDWALAVEAALATLFAPPFTNAQLATMPPGTIKGNNGGSAAVPSDLTVAQLKTLLAISSADIGGLGSLATVNQVTNALMANMAAGTVKANLSGGSAVPSDATLNDLAAALRLFSTGGRGQVNAPTSGEVTDNKFLRADNSWQFVTGSGLGDVVGPGNGNSAQYNLAIFSDTSGSAIIDGGALPMSAPGGRLTLSAGVPVPSSDVLAATTLRYTPDIHNRIWLYVGGRWRAYIFPETSLSLAGLAANTNHDIFGYMNAGVFTLEAVTNWSSATVRSTALASQDGVEVKTGATDRLYLGTIRTTNAAGQCEDSATKRYVWNNYNQVERPLHKHDSTDVWTYNSTTIRQARAATDNKVEFVLGLDREKVTGRLACSVFNSTTSFRYIVAGLGLDRTTGFDGTFGQTNCSNAFQTRCYAEYNARPGIGYHYLSWNERSAGTDTQTWVGDGNTPTLDQQGITGHVCA